MEQVTGAWLESLTLSLFRLPPPTDPGCAHGFARKKGLSCEGKQLPTHRGSTSAATDGQVHVLGAGVFEIETETPLLCTPNLPSDSPALEASCVSSHTPKDNLGDLSPRGAAPGSFQPSPVLAATAQM